MILDDVELKDLVEIHLAGSAEIALANPRIFHADTIISDIDLRRQMDGIKLVQELRKLGSKARICVHSNTTDPGAAKEALLMGADDFLLEPMPQVRIFESMRCNLQPNSIFKAVNARTLAIFPSPRWLVRVTYGRSKLTGVWYQISKFCV